MVYDNAGRLWFQGNALNNITTFGYDPADRQTAVMNPLVEITTTVYDAAGQVTGTISPMLERTTNTFDLAGRQVAETNPRGFITTTVYDANGWVAATIDALTNRTSFAYDNVGQEIAVQDALGNIITTIYSAQRQPLVTINPLGLRTTITYDALGRKLTETNPLGEITTTIYDAVSNVLATINPLGNRTSFSYDVINQQISQEDAEGHTSETIYDLAGNVITSVNANDDRTSFVYNAANYKMAQIDANDHRTTYGYDPDGLLTSIENPLGEITSMSYDIASRKKAQVDPLGRITSYTYNSNGQEIGRQYSDSTRVTMSYDANGNRIQLQDTTGDTNFAYDALDRTESVTNPDSQTVTYNYDAVSNRTLMVDPDAGQFTYSYDNLYRVKTIQNPEGDSTSFVYDDANRPITKNLANGTRTSITYDAAGQVTNLFHLKSDNSVFSAFTYTYDKTGNRTQVVEDTGDRVTWTYDDTYQLTREHRSGTDAYNVTYTYDPVGNRLTSDDGSTITTYVYDEANRTKTTDDGTVVTTYSFDAAGNQRTVEDTNGVITYTWDINNQNTGVEKPNGDLFTFTYNGDMVRVQSEDPNGTTKFVYDQQNVLLESDDLDTTQVVYTLNPKEFGNLISRYDTVAADSDIYHYDALGSTVALTDSSEVEIDAYVYYAFGKIKSSSGTTDQPFQWVGETGYYAESELDRYHIRRRNFDPSSGRFLSEDPMRDDEEDLYCYVGNNAINNSDPSGLEQRKRTWNENWDPIDKLNLQSSNSLNNYADSKNQIKDPLLYDYTDEKYRKVGISPTAAQDQAHILPEIPIPQIELKSHIAWPLESDASWNINDTLHAWSFGIWPNSAEIKEHYPPPEKHTYDPETGLWTGSNEIYLNAVPNPELIDTAIEEMLSLPGREEPLLYYRAYQQVVHGPEADPRNYNDRGIYIGPKGGTLPVPFVPGVSNSYKNFLKRNANGTSQGKIDTLKPYLKAKKTGSKFKLNTKEAQSFTIGTKTFSVSKDVIENGRRLAGQGSPKNLDVGVEEVIREIEKELPGFTTEIQLVIRKAPGKDLTDLDIVTKKAIIQVSTGTNSIGRSIANVENAIKNTEFAGRKVIGVVREGTESRLLRRPQTDSRFVTDDISEFIDFLKDL